MSRETLLETMAPEQSMVMLQFKHVGSIPSLEEVRRLFDLHVDELDTQFGVIATDPSANLYTVLIDAGAVKRVESVLAARPNDEAEGVFANPRIEPFGPPQD